MRSLYVRILIASLLTALVSFGVFMALGKQVTERTTRQFYVATYRLQLSQAVEHYQSGGAPALRAFVSRLDQAFGFEHHLVNVSGMDLADGLDRSSLLVSDRRDPDAPRMVDGRFVFVRASADGRYRLIVIVASPFTLWTFAPFYLVVLVAVALLSWLVAIGIASPLRSLTRAVDRFGGGELDVRVTYRSRNEIGRLAASFNHMADRIQTLLSAERRLLQDISHELRSPLARLSFALELARTAANRQAAIDRAVKEVDRVTALASELIEVTRAEGDPAVRKNERIEIDSLVRDVSAAASLEGQGKAVAVSVESATTRSLSGDTELLRRAVDNVLRNAVRFAPQGTEVDVVVHEEPAETSITVRDHGPGVPEETLPRLFEAFYRVDGSREAKSGGLGLGLAIAYRAVLLHHGSLRAENASPGLRVTLTLPHIERAA